MLPCNHFGMGISVYGSLLGYGHLPHWEARKFNLEAFRPSSFHTEVCLGGEKSKQAH
jgi:hypothetical protein